MVKINTLFKKISRIRDIERERYLNFLENSYINNLQHSEKNLIEFPRWSIISGYYAMHDVTKLFICKKFGIKIDFNVHANTIIVLEKLIENKEIPKLLEKAYREFLDLSNDLNEAKQNRVKAQYYTGTAYSLKRYSEEAKDFLEQVKSYLNKIRELLE